MSGGPARPGPDPARSRRRLPFWALQCAELAVALVFVDVSVHLASGGSLVAGAAVLVALALTARGPIGIVRICPKRVHVALVVTAALLVALSPILPVLRPDVAGIVVAELGAAGIVRLATLTRTAEPEGPRGAPGELVDAHPAASSPSPAGGGSGGTRAEGRSSDAPGAPPVAEQAARTAAAAAALGRRAATHYGPVAEVQVRRALRGAGRTVGRMLGHPPDGDKPG